MLLKCCSIVLVLFSAIAINGQSSLNIHIEGIKDLKGDIYIGLYDNKIYFRNTDSVFMQQIIPVNDHEIIAKMENLPKGEYALTLFHDKNSNGKLDKNWFGKPKEKYGFSNNPKIRFKAPGFDKCSFIVKEDVDITILMK